MDFKHSKMKVTKFTLLLLLVFCFFGRIMGFPTKTNDHLKFESCELPPPQSIWTDSITSTSLYVGWSPVAGAYNYRIQVYNQVSGALIGTYFSFVESKSISNLPPGALVRIEVSATSCQGGKYGNPISIVEQLTSIITVDVFSYLKCRPPNPTAIAEINSKLNVSVSPENPVFHFYTEPYLQSQTKFESEFEPDIFEPNLLRVYVGLMQQCFTTETPAPTLKVKYNTPFGEAKDWLEISNLLYINQELHFTVTFLKKSIYSIRYCDGGIESSERDFSTPSVSPNPFTDKLTVTAPALSGTHTTVQLFDASGVLIGHIETDSGLFEFKTDLIPPGIYYIRILSDIFPVTYKAIKIE